MIVLDGIGHNVLHYLPVKDMVGEFLESCCVPSGVAEASDAEVDKAAGALVKKYGRLAKTMANTFGNRALAKGRRPFWVKVGDAVERRLKQGS